MAVRGVYTKEEKAMLATFEKTAEPLVGWGKSLRRRLATEESMKNFASVNDPWNPLWNDGNYAADTRWGGIIAFPFYETGVAYMHLLLIPPPGNLYPHYIYIGEDWKVLRPIRVNDSFRVWRRRPQCVDISNLDGKGLRTFRFIPIDTDVINQRDEVISTMKLYLEYSVITEPPKKTEPQPDYKYTKEELAFIYRIADEEKIRGAKIRYWEDVKVGETLTPVAAGPTSVSDMVSFNAGSGPGSGLVRVIRKRSPEALIVDPVTGVSHHDSAIHFSDRAAHLRGIPHSIHFGNFGRQQFVRCVTNWMGDDGCIRKFQWRHMGPTYIGDAIFSRGKVTNKRVENGEHLVDLSLWQVTIRGDITESVAATVSLLSRESPYKWK